MDSTVLDGLMKHALENQSGVKLEFDIDIKDEDLAAFALQYPLGPIGLDDELTNIQSFPPPAKDVFCDNDASFLGDNPFMLSSKVSPILKHKRKLFQPQRLNNLPLATFPTIPKPSVLEANEEDDVSESEYMEIHQELEQELQSGDEDQFIPNSSPDTVEYASQFSINNNYQKGDEEEFTEPPDTKTDDFYQEIKKEVPEVDVKTLKYVEEEWRGYWGIKCNQCPKVYTEKNEFDVHYLNRHASNPVYTCSCCDKNINNYSNFRSHCYRHIAEGRHKCPICSKAFTLRNILQMHILSNHTEAKPFSCDECDKCFASKTSLSLHKRKHKVSVKGTYPCTSCSKILHTKGGLQSHMNIHRLGRRFMCDICGKTFTQKVNLQQHLKQHTGERPHKCNICDKSFAEKSHLNRHKSFHTEKRPFICHICLKSYKTDRCLRVHSKVHQWTRNHKCSTCDKAFMSSTKLKQHTNIHTGERPYKCKYCERTFTNYPNWLKHTRRQHKVNHRTGALLTPEEQQSQLKKKPKKEVKLTPLNSSQKESAQATDFVSIVNGSFSPLGNEIFDYTKSDSLNDQMTLTSAAPAMHFIADDSRLSLQSQFFSSSADFQNPFYIQAGLHEEQIPLHIQQLLFSPTNVHQLLQSQLMAKMEI